MVAVTTALVKMRTAKMTAKPATVRRAFKARITDTHVFYAAHSADKKRLPRFPRSPCLYLSCGQAERCLNSGLAARRYARWDWWPCLRSSTPQTLLGCNVTPSKGCWQRTSSRASVELCFALSRGSAWQNRYGSGRSRRPVIACRRMPALPGLTEFERIAADGRRLGATRHGCS
jgi:hypothetical protein